MFTSTKTLAQDVHYELVYTRRLNHQRGYAFGCDAQGHVDLNALTDHDRNDYFYARVVVGSELLSPVVAVVS